MEPDTWMNDVGEKIPNWFESARLYNAYSGDNSVMKIVKELIDYSLDHGISPDDFAWPDFPYTTTNAGDTLFRGFTSAGRFAMHEIQVDHAGEMGLTYYRMYQYSGDEKYLKAAKSVADVLSDKARTGTANQSVWPYRIIMNTGKITAEYGANWIGCFTLLDNLVKAGIGDTASYKKARDKARNFMLQYPLKTGFWTDGHSDNNVNSNDYKSNMSASNFTLYLFDHPEFDGNWKEDIPELIKWTEDYFVDRCYDDEPSTMYGANIVGEQDSFLIKMDYQTARYAAECARWYSISKDSSYLEKAYRALNWVTYCNDEYGMAYESPVSKGILSWWSDCYGEGPRMFYQAFAGIPDWTPTGENHILYSENVLKEVKYQIDRIEYSVEANSGKEYLHLAFFPGSVTLNGSKLELQTNLKKEGYMVMDLLSGDFAVTIYRLHPGSIIIDTGD